MNMVALQVQLSDHGTHRVLSSHHGHFFLLQSHRVSFAKYGLKSETSCDWKKSNRRLRFRGLLARLERGAQEGSCTIGGK